MKQSKALSLLTGLLVMAPTSLAPTAQAQPQIDCQNATSNIEINFCLGEEYKEADLQLNEAYRRVIRSVSGDRRELLIDAQLAWIEFRDKSCEFEVYPSRGGTGFSGFLSTCLTRVTEARIAELNNIQRR